MNFPMLCGSGIFIIEFDIKNDLKVCIRNVDPLIGIVTRTWKDLPSIIKNIL